MTARRRPTAVLGIVIAAVIAAFALAPGSHSARSATAAMAPHTFDGPSGRYLLDGRWLLRRDPRDRGLRARWFTGPAGPGWTSVSVPNAWNAHDQSKRSSVGEPVWYRRDFRLPRAPRTTAWLVRFESVDNRAVVWLNGHRLGAHDGAYLPFELPLTQLRPGVNTLVVRTDNRGGPGDIPPLTGIGGWWNYGGIVRDVYLRRVDTVDLAQVTVRPLLPCPTCAATVDYFATVRNWAREPETVRLSGSFGGQHVGFEPATLAPGSSRVLTARVGVVRPHLWSIADPHLYAATITAAAAPPGRRGVPVASYRLMSGIRSITVSPHGELLLNGRRVDLRGVDVHEDSLRRGAALTIADRNRLLASVRRLGATVIRAHYPLDPYMYEQADRLGLLVWSEIPVYRMAPNEIGRPAVQAAAVTMLRADIAANQNHPSIFVWSVENELDSTAGLAEGAYLARAAAAAKAADPTRPVAASLADYPWTTCGARYHPLDVIGLNEYYGWYPSEPRIGDLSGALDRMRACEPRKAIIVTEFGAEANRTGPAAEKGTYAFQHLFADRYLRVFASKPWLSGALWFALEDFRVHPGWGGGDPRPDPPWNEKGLLSRAGIPKPAFADVARSFRATDQYPR